MLAILGFIAPFLPDLLGFGKSWLDHKQELQMMRLQGELAEKQHAHRVDEIEITAAVKDRTAARKPHESYGVQLLQAAANQNHVWRWSFNLAFMAFAFLDWLISAVRPTISYWVFGMYCLHKAAMVWLVFGTTEPADPFFDRIFEVMTTKGFYSDFDQEVLQVILGFWFGDRVRRRARGEV